MRDHGDRLAELPGRAAEEEEDLSTGPRVQVAGRLVREDEVGSGGERTGDGDALLLSAAQLVGAVIHPRLQPEGVHERRDPRRLLCGGAPGVEVERQPDVLGGREGGNEVE